MEATAQVVVPAFHGDHADARVLERGEAVRGAALEGLVRAPAALDVHHGEHPPSVRERHARAGLQVGARRIENNGQAE